MSPQAPVRGLQAIGGAVRRIYAEGGVRGFWTGNGLSVVKILPESAIKFFTYESSVSHLISQLLPNPEAFTLFCVCSATIFWIANLETVVRQVC